jgi:hypothetical protein
MFSKMNAFRVLAVVNLTRSRQYTAIEGEHAPTETDFIVV